jgi:hypothetical protein
MKKVLSTFLGAIISLSSTALSFTCNALPHFDFDGRTLTQPQTGDTSSWLEIANKYGDDDTPYSLLVRETALPKCNASYSQTAIEQWFEGLSPDSKLKRFVVSSNANSHPGFHGKSNRETDYIAGLSEPTPDDRNGLSCFRLSEQEIKFYLYDEWRPTPPDDEPVYGYHTRTPGSTPGTAIMRHPEGRFYEIPMGRWYPVVVAIWVNSEIFD